MFQFVFRQFIPPRSFHWKSVLCAALLTASHVLVPGAIQAQSYTQFTQEQVAAVDRVLKSLVTGRPNVLDFRNPDHVTFFLAGYAGAGITPQNNPKLAALVENIRAQHATNGPADPGFVYIKTRPALPDVTSEQIDAAEAGLQIRPRGDEPPVNLVGPIQTLTSFQEFRVAQRGFSGSGLVSIPRQPVECSQSLWIANESGVLRGQPDIIDQQLACENVQLYAEAELVPGDTYAKMVMTSTWTDQPSAADQEAITHVVAVTGEGSVIPKEIISNNPNDLNGDGMIKFCFGRVAQDCDYDPAGSSKKNVFLPIDGNTQYDSPIQDPLTNGSTVAISMTLPEPHPNGGGGCFLEGDVATFFQDYVTFSDGNKQINWNDPTVQFGQIDPCMPNGSIVYYNMVMNLKVEIDSNVLPTFFGISSSPQTPVSDGHWKQLDETRIYWSCVSEDTLVTLADGRERTIAEISTGDRIRSDADGTILTVAATYTGTEEEPLIKVVTENGYELELTKTHPVPTEAGIRLAQNLRTVDKLYTKDGLSAIASVSMIEYTGKVYNLSVGRPVDGVTLTPDNRTFYADGILVGDNEMQWLYDRPGTNVAELHQPVVPVMSVRARTLMEARFNRTIEARLPSSHVH